MNRQRTCLRATLTALGLLLATAPVAAECLPDGIQASGAIYRICAPEPESWNGSLVLFAHGYVAFNEPLAIPDAQLTLSDGTNLPDLLQGLGFAFATTSYSTNGLAVVPGLADLLDLVEIFRATLGEPARVYLVGASEGGILTALAVEGFPEVFDGGVAACGPIGSFRGQINYWGSFRVLFDYFFPTVMPSSPVHIPPGVIQNWDQLYEPRIAEAIAEDPAATAQLLRTANAPIDRDDPSTVEQTVSNLMWYNVFATNDGAEKLGGQPFDNHRRIYRGSDDDVLLNDRVDRFLADPEALEEIESHYETTGDLAVPLITLHTTGDPIIPFWHEPLYRLKVMATASTAFHVNIPIARYGHCNFKAGEALIAFLVMLLKANTLQASDVTAAADLLPEPEARREFYHLVHRYLLRPKRLR